MNLFVQDVPGYEGLYSCSISGEVCRIGKGRGRGVRIGRVLKACLTTAGYPTVSLWKDGEPRTHYVHHLVWRIFRGEVPEGFEINHIDLNKQNPALGNLEIVTHLENIRHEIRASGGRRGEGNGHAVLTVEQVRYIRENYKFRDKKFGGMQLAKKFGVSKATICDITHNRSWNPGGETRNERKRHNQ
jgi:hypothetical protein